MHLSWASRGEQNSKGHEAIRGRWGAGHGSPAGPQGRKKQREEEQAAGSEGAAGITVMLPLVQGDTCDLCADSGSGQGPAGARVKDAREANSMQLGPISTILYLYCVS